MLLLFSFTLFCVGQDQQPAPKKQTEQVPNRKVPPAAERNINGQTPPLAQGANRPVTGKTGEHSTAITDTSTATAGVTTPGYQTTTGAAQKQPAANTRRPGAPPNFGQAGQLPHHADANAAKAIEAEVGGAPGGGTLGINNVMPSYSRDSGSQKQQSTGAGNGGGTQGQGTKATSANPTPKAQ